MSYRNTIILLAVLVLLGSFVYFFERRDEPTRNEALPGQSVPLISIPPVDIVRVELGQGDARVVLSRSQGGALWQLVSDAASATASPEEADQGRVDRLVSSLASLSAARTVAEQAADLEEFGLKDPIAEVTLHTTAGKQQTVRFGSASPSGNGRYAQLEGSPKVYLVFSHTVDEVSRTIVDPPRPRPTPTKEPPLATPTAPSHPAEATPTD